MASQCNLTKLHLNFNIRNNQFVTVLKPMSRYSSNASHQRSPQFTSLEVLHGIIGHNARHIHFHPSPPNKRVPYDRRAPSDPADMANDTNETQPCTKYLDTIKNTSQFDNIPCPPPGLPAQAPTYAPTHANPVQANSLGTRWSQLDRIRIPSTIYHFL